MKRIIKHAVQISLLSAFILPTAQADDCIENAQDQEEMNVCSQIDYLGVDAQLNNRFAEISKRIAKDSKTHQLLEDAQKAWVIFRDAECTFATSQTAGGSAHPMAYNICLTDLTQKRSDQILQYLNCEEGDVSCPVPAAK